MLNLLENLMRKERDDFMNENALSEEQVRFYNDNGYLVVDNILSSEECDFLLAIFEEHADQSYSAILNLDRSVPKIREAMKNKRIVAVIEKLQNAEVVGLMSQVLFKKVGSPYASQAWNPHQDNAYPRAAQGAYITVNVFLEDSDLENGTLYIYPGSHREPLLPFEPVKSYREDHASNPGNLVVVPEKYRKVDLRIRKGGMLIMHGHVIHGSYPNRSSYNSRPLFSISYIPKGFKFLRGKNANRMTISLR